MALQAGDWAHYLGSEQLFLTFLGKNITEELTRVLMTSTSFQSKLKPDPFGSRAGLCA